MLLQHFRCCTCNGNFLDCMEEGDLAKQFFNKVPDTELPD